MSLFEKYQYKFKLYWTWPQAVKIVDDEQLGSLFLHRFLKTFPMETHIYGNICQHHGIICDMKFQYIPKIKVLQFCVTNIYGLGLSSNGWKNMADSFSY